jgi:hypothetical protein
VAIAPEPDMLAEGKRRAAMADAGNVRFVAGSSDSLPALRPSLGLFRAALMGQSFHWMVDKDRVLEDLSAMIDEADGAVAFVKPRRVSIPDEMRAAQDSALEILERYLANVPPGPHPNGRHDPFEEILSRSPFPRIEIIERVYETRARLTIESILGYEYTISHVLTRLGDSRGAFEREARAALSWVEKVGEISVTRRDEALIGRRSRLLCNRIRANRQPPVWPDEMACVAAGISFEVVLMLGFGLPEVACWNNFSNNLSRPQA